MIYCFQQRKIKSIKQRKREEKSSWTGFRSEYTIALCILNFILTSFQIKSLWSIVKPQTLVDNSGPFINEKSFSIHNGARTYGAQAPDRSHAPRGPQTPLGEPITNQASAMLLAEDPLTWHLRYLLNLGAIGNILGEDVIVMHVMIDAVIRRIADPAFRTQIRGAWYNFHVYNREEYMRHWRQRTLEDEEAKACLRDLARMLVNRRQKKRDCVRFLGKVMSNDLRDGNVRRARRNSYLINSINQALQQAETRNRLRNGTSGVNNQGGQRFLRLSQAGWVLSRLSHPNSRSNHPHFLFGHSPLSIMVR